MRPTIREWQPDKYNRNFSGPVTSRLLHSGLRNQWEVEGCNKNVDGQYVLVEDNLSAVTNIIAHIREVKQKGEEISWKPEGEDRRPSRDAKVTWLASPPEVQMTNVDDVPCPIAMRRNA